jgi:hypothetical protein
MRLAASFAGVARSEALDSGSRLLNLKRQNQFLENVDLQATRNLIQVVSLFPTWHDLGGGHKSERNIRMNKKLGYLVFEHQPINDNLKPTIW